MSQNSPIYKKKVSLYEKKIRNSSQIKGAVTRIFYSLFAKSLLKLGLNAFAHTRTKCCRRKISRECWQEESTVRRTFFDDFCKIQAQNLNILGQLFQVVIHFYPGHRWPKTLINSFTVRFVRCLNKKRTIIFTFLFM